MVITFKFVWYDETTDKMLEIGAIPVEFDNEIFDLWSIRIPFQIDFCEIYYCINILIKINNRYYNTLPIHMSYYLMNI